MKQYKIELNKEQIKMLLIFCEQRHNQAVDYLINKSIELRCLKYKETKKEIQQYLNETIEELTQLREVKYKLKSLEVKNE